MRELSLFTGAGGGVLGSLLLGHRVVGYVEFEGYPQAVLASRIRNGNLDPAPIFGDVRAFARRHARRFAGRVDVVSAGFPCQPFSVAGAGRAEEDARNMWPATADVLRRVRPPLALLENVPGLLAKPYFGHILGELAALGFDAEWTVLGAHDVGAPHRRDRLWILAFSDAGRELLRNEPESEPRGIGARIARDDEGRENVADSARRGLGEHGRASGSGGHPHECGPARHSPARSPRDPQHEHRRSPSREESATNPAAPAAPRVAMPASGVGKSRFEPGDPASQRADREPRGCGRVLADSDRRGCLLERQPDGQPGLQGSRGTEPHGCDGADVEHAPLSRLEGGGKRLPRCGRCGEDAGQPESGLGRGPDGLADRLEWPAARGEWPSRGDQHDWEPPRVLPRGARTDFRRQRLRAIGNGQVPACVVAAWRELAGRAVEG